MKIFRPSHRILSSVFLVFLWTLRSFASTVAVGGSSSSSFFLTKATYDSLTANKTVFIKWAAPWCGHSQELAPAWDRLVEAVAADDSSDWLLIAEVDCSKEQEWCAEMGYTAYPTLTYGDGSKGGIFLKMYTSVKKDFEDLLRFYKKELLHKSFCTPGNLAVCGDAEEQDRVRRYSELSIEDLERFVAKEEARISEAEDECERRNQELQLEYDQILKEHESKKASIKRQLKLFKKLLREARNEATGGP